MKKFTRKAYESMQINDPEILDIAEDVSNELDSFEKINLFIAYTYFDPEDFAEFFADADKLLTSTERIDKSTETLDKFKSQILKLIKKLDDVEIEALLSKYGFEDLYDPNLSVASDSLEKSEESKFKILGKMTKSYESKNKSTKLSKFVKSVLTKCEEGNYTFKDGKLNSNRTNSEVAKSGKKYRIRLNGEEVRVAVEDLEDGIYPEIIDYITDEMSNEDTSNLDIDSNFVDMIIQTNQSVNGIDVHRSDVEDAYSDILAITEFMNSGQFDAKKYLYDTLYRKKILSDLLALADNEEKMVKALKLIGTSEENSSLEEVLNTNEDIV